MFIYPLFIVKIVIYSYNGIDYLLYTNFLSNQRLKQNNLIFTF